MSETRPLALVTGVGKRAGLGFAVCEMLAKNGYSVILSARNSSQAELLAGELRSDGSDVTALTLDIADATSRARAASFIEARRGSLDVLINNAAAAGHIGEKAVAADLAEAEAALRTTLLGTWGLIQATLPLLRRSPHPRIVNVSSGAGSHGDGVFGLGTSNAMGPSYAVAKAALNALTSALATELAATNVRINAVCPGFIATFPGAEAMGARPVEAGARSVLWAALLDDEGPSGGFFRDGNAVPW